VGPWGESNKIPGFRGGGVALKSKKPKKKNQKKQHQQKKGNKKTKKKTKKKKKKTPMGLNLGSKRPPVNGLMHHELVLLNVVDIQHGKRWFSWARNGITRFQFGAPGVKRMPLPERVKNPRVHAPVDVSFG